MNKFQIKDQVGRDTFKQLCTNTNQRWCKYVAEAKDPFSVWDVAYLSGYTSNFNKVKVIGEIKVRKYKSDEFEGWYLEVDKAKSLLIKKLSSKANGKEIKLTYINIFNDNITLIWDITNINLNDYEIKKKLLPNNDFDDTLVLKNVIELRRYEAEAYETDEEQSMFTVYRNDLGTENNDEEELPF